MIGGDSQVIGSVGETSFRLRKRIWYRNSFQYSLSGKFIEENGPTHLRCKIGLHPFIRAFFIFWFGVVLLGGGAMSIKTIAMLGSAYGRLPANWWLGVAIPFLMLGVGAAIFSAGRYLAQDEPRFLIDFVRRTLEARES